MTSQSSNQLIKFIKRVNLSEPIQILSMFNRVERKEGIE